MFVFFQGSRGEVGPVGPPGPPGKLVSNISKSPAVYLLHTKHNAFLKNKQGEENNLQRVI